MDQEKFHLAVGRSLMKILTKFFKNKMCELKLADEIRCLHSKYLKSLE